MRDHPGHRLPIPAGIWGAKLNQGKRNQIKTLAKEFFNQDHSQNYKFVDQIVLKVIKGTIQRKSIFVMAVFQRDFWPIVKHFTLAHDSYHCDKFPEGSKPFPIKRNQREFIGSKM